MKNYILVITILLFVISVSFISINIAEARVTDPLELGWEHITDDEAIAFEIWCVKNNNAPIIVTTVTDPTLRYIQVPGVDLPGGGNDCEVTAIYADGERRSSGIPELFINRGNPKWKFMRNQ